MTMFGYNVQLIAPWNMKHKAVYDRRIYNCSDLKLDLYCYIYETL